MIEGSFTPSRDFPALGLAHPTGARTAMRGRIQAYLARIEFLHMPPEPLAHHPARTRLHALVLSPAKRA